MQKAKVVSVFFFAFLITGVTSYFSLSTAYAQKNIITTTSLITIENQGQQIVMENDKYDVIGSKLVEGENGTDFYELKITRSESNSWEAPEEEGYGALGGSSFSQIQNLTIPSEAYEFALSTESPVAVSSFTTTETKPVDPVPIATGIGILVGALAVVFTAWHQKSWGDAALHLAERGLHDMTIRDVQIVGYMMQMKEFTIPELTKLTRTSKITVWRTVQKLMERGLVQKTEKTKPASSGLGGRGKPSLVYRYTGTSTREET